MYVLIKFIDLVRFFNFKIVRAVMGIYYKKKLKSSGKNIYFDSGVTVLGPENIEIGENIFFMKNSFLYANEGGVIKIGNNFALNSNTQLGASGGSIYIGDNVLIGPNCVLRAADHVFASLEKPIRFQGHQGGVITIEDDVWIGANCVILKDVTIGRGSVVAAGAVVTKSVEPFSIIAGVPAKVISKRV